MGTVAHPIHNLQCMTIYRILTKMILNKDGGTTNPSGFLNKRVKFIAVMQHVNKKTNVKRRVVEREFSSRKQATGDSAARPHRNLNTLDYDVGPGFGQ